MKDNSIRGKEIRLYGYPICTGVAIARPFLFTVAEENIPEFPVPEDKIDQEVDRYFTALKNSRKDLLFLRKRLEKEGGTEAASILSGHLEIMHDPLMTVQMEEEIRRKGMNTEYVFKSVIDKYKEKFSRITDEFFQERFKDVLDISRRIISHLRKHERCTLAELSSKCIVFAHELAPSDTAEANTEMIEAFVTRSGSETSHVAIMARGIGLQGIPFVSNVDFPDFSLATPPLVIVDGTTGEVIINPNKETVNKYRNEKKKLKVQVKELQKNKCSEAETTDGYKIRLSANIEMFEELDSVHQFGGEAVGLFRSEYLFLSRETFPSEEEQFLIYRSVVEKIGQHLSIIRTFDIGGDKFGNFQLSRPEKNPYLGCRAIRLMLKEQNLFRSQLKAILRASAFGEVGILFPMISGVAELREAKGILDEAKEELRKKGIPFSRHIPIGCMIEIPSAAITCDILAQECDFFSIGTNDLVQYCLAVDRGNAAMSYLYSPAHPSILRLIRRVIEEANRAERPVSICGEIAADPRFTPLLLGLHVREFSVSPPALPIIHQEINKLSMQTALELSEYCFTLKTPAEIERALDEAYRKRTST